MKKYRKLKIGIVGGGYWSTNIIKTLEDNSFNNVYVFEIDKIKQKTLKNKFSFLKFCNSLSDFLKTKYDVVLLITPPSTHYKLAKKILNAGNNIFIEKPSTLSTKNLEKIIKLAKNKNRLLMSGYIYCYNVYIQFIIKILKP